MLAEVKKKRAEQEELTLLVKKVLDLCGEDKENWQTHIEYALADYDDALICYKSLLR